MADAWFADKIAPDSAKDDGCHPQEAEVLKSYLRGTIPTASEAARAITLPIESETNPIAEVPRLWALLIDALTDLPASYQSRTQALWRELIGFGHLWADLHHTGQWRRLIKTCSQAERDAFRKDIQNNAAIEARLLVAQLGAIPLSWGYECICDALEKSNAALDMEVAAAAEWLRVAGKRIYGEIGERETNYALASSRDLWKGGEKMSEERWMFWKERLRSVAKKGELGEGTRDAAKEAIETMEAAEDDTSTFPGT